MFRNAAIFVNGTRTMRNIDVEWDETEVRVLNRSTGKVMATHQIVELAAEQPPKTMAWDVLDPRGDRIRMTVQVGCGCSGMHKYENDPSYSGTLERK
jgi:hypothetical protein